MCCILHVVSSLVEDVVSGKLKRRIGNIVKSANKVKTNFERIKMVGRKRWQTVLRMGENSRSVSWRNPYLLFHKVSQAR